MSEHRLCAPTAGAKIRIVDIREPVSFFKVLDKVLKDRKTTALHRCFSLARRLKARTLVVERIPSMGIIEDENIELEKFHATQNNTHSCDYVYRLSFWRSSFSRQEEIDHQNSRRLVGYFLYKNDTVNGNYHKSHIFEGVFLSDSKTSGYMHGNKKYEIMVNQKKFKISGVLYAQQNTISKCCAHVALYSLLSINDIVQENLSFSNINRICNQYAKKTEGLDIKEIEKVLEEFGMDYFAIDYRSKKNVLPNQANSRLYQKALYMGIESGPGAFLVFAADPANKKVGHIIPLFGHTFDRDTWVPHAEPFYFSAEPTDYISSDHWTGNFIGHDDHFGPNFCMPRHYMDHSNVWYTIEILRRGVKYSGMHAEWLAAPFLFSALEKFKGRPDNNFWLKLLLDSIEKKKRSGQSQESRNIISRTISMTKKQYSEHIASSCDRLKNREVSANIKFLEHRLPAYIWLVEISGPQLFPTNTRKLADIVLDATKLFLPEILQKILKLVGSLSDQSNKKSAAVQETIERIKKEREKLVGLPIPEGMISSLLALSANELDSFPFQEFESEMQEYLESLYSPSLYAEFIVAIRLPEWWCYPSPRDPSQYDLRYSAFESHLPSCSL